MPVFLPEPLERLAAAVADALTVDLVGLGDTNRVAALEQVHVLEARLAAYRSGLLAAAETAESTVVECGRATRSYLVEELRVGPGEASARLRLARDLPGAPLVAAALAAGDVNEEHARLVCGLLRRIPVELREVVEAALLELAREHPPFLVARAVAQIRARYGLDDDADERAARRHAERGIDCAEVLDGYRSISGLMSPELGEALDAAFTAAGVHARPTSDDDRTVRQRQHDALLDLVTGHLGRGDLPEVNGERPRVVVTIDYETLIGDLTGRWGLFDSGIPASVATVRRLACDAEILPAVLGARGDVLDLGVASRTFSTAVKRAARIRDGGRCGFPRCRRRIAECHHILWWSHGGRSTLDNAVWLCAFHHWLAHEGGWSLRRTTNGTYTWTRPDGHQITGHPPPPYRTAIRRAEQLAAGKCGGAAG